MNSKKVNCLDTNQQFIKSYTSIAAAERELGLSSGCINKAIRKGTKSRGYYWKYANGEAIKTDEQSEVYKRGLTEMELRSKHDNFYKIMQAVKNLKKGIFIPEPEFITTIGLSGGYRRWLDSSELNKYRGKAGGQTYWSHPDSITEMKNDAVLT